MRQIGGDTGAKSDTGSNRGQPYADGHFFRFPFADAEDRIEKGEQSHAKDGIVDDL